ncbi:MAG TPA: cell filamentation protein Fic [Firmicutes bacterium]|nr:cell filamentation protein Fic [Bacillota bacterium]
MFVLNNLEVISSTEEFLVFKTQEQEKGIAVRYENENLWMTQKAMAELFNVEQPAIAKHLINIYNELELDKDSTYSKMELVQKEGSRNVKRNVEFYSLDAIISVGYRVNSRRATQFRRWATQVLKKFTIEGYALDKKRMENGIFLNKDYFEKLLEEIREIRLSERRFYQKITDIYATSIDYDAESPTTIEFFKKVQNKMHYAITHQTAAEIIYNRADHTKENMNLTSWKNSPNGKIMESDVVIAKNYLTKEEIKDLERIVNAFLELAERRAERHIPMTMEDWSTRIDKYLLADDLDVLKDSGKISHEIAVDKALSEFEKYRVTQDKLFESDFDKFIIDIENKDIN